MINNTFDGPDDAIDGELVDGDLIAETEDEVVGVKELKDVGLRVAVGCDVFVDDLHLIKEMLTIITTMTVICLTIKCHLSHK